MKRRGIFSAPFLVVAVLLLGLPAASPQVPAAPLRLTLNCDSNPDHVCDSANPCLDGVTQCRTLNGVEWDHAALRAALAIVANQFVGTPTDINLAPYCVGANCSSATYSLRFVVTNWSIGGTGTSHLLHAGMVAGNSQTSGPLQLQVCFGGACDTDAGEDWSYQAGVNDTTAPPIPVDLVQSGSGTGTATLSFQTVSDAAGNIPSSGMARYSIRDQSTGAEISSLPSVGPGLLLTPTSYNIGNTVGGINQCTQSGVNWTIQSTSDGFEASDKGQVCGANITGDFTAIGTATSLPVVNDWAKLGFEARESTAVDAADAQCYFMVSNAYGTSLQSGFRAVTGNDYRSGMTQAPVDPLPLKLMLRRHDGNLWDCAYSADGQAWTYIWSNVAQTLPNTLIVGPMATPTALGQPGIQLTAQMQQVSISNTGRASTVLTLSGPKNVAVRAVDVAGNMSANSVAITLTPGGSGPPPQAGAKKWHPGYYINCCRNNYSTGFRGNPNPPAAQASRFAEIDNIGSLSPNVKGVHRMVKWIELEPTHGDYASGIALIRADIERAKNEPNPLRFMLQLMDEPNYSLCNSMLCQANFYPQYIEDAGCIQQEDSPTYGVISNFKYWIPQCVQYEVDLLTALGAALDGEPYLEAVQLDYEQVGDVVRSGDWDRTNFMNGVEAVMQAAAAAFPHTNLNWTANWGWYVGADVAQLFTYAQANLVGIGDQDACDMNPTTGAPQYGEFPDYIDSDNIFAGYGGYDENHQAGLYRDQRDHMFSMWGAENSELGYNSVCGAPGFVGYAGVGSPLRAQGYMSLWHHYEQMHASHVHIDWNNYVGAPEQQWSPGVTGSVSDLVATHPLTHTDCPTDYPNGCDTGDEPPPTAVHKWHPGHYASYIQAGAITCGVGCNATRHANYGHLNEANVKGTMLWIDWKFLEADAGNDFVAGMDWLRNELAYVRTNYPGKQVGLLLNVAPYYPSSMTQCPSYYPAYFCDAGCVYLEGSAGSGGGHDSFSWFKNRSDCRGYFKRLMAAYGAVFDSDPTLEFVRIQQETDDAHVNQGISGYDQDNGWKDIVAASVAAFPTTQIWVPINWVGVETAASKEALVAYYKSIGAAMGDGDTIPAPYNESPSYPSGYPCPSTAWGCVVRGRNQSIGATNHDFCGEFVSMTTIELSNQGYSSVPGGPGFSSDQITQVWNNQRCAQYGVWEMNLNEVTDDSCGGCTQYWGGSMGQLWAINNRPFSHTTKPAGYQ